MQQKIRVRRIVAGALAFSLLSAGALYGAVSAFAATSTLVTITSIAPKKLAALTTNETVTITGTGFDNSTIDTVDLGPCTGATWIVATATSLVVKTPNNTCGTATVGSTPVTITIHDIDGNTATFTGTSSTGLFFVTPPTLAASDPVFTDNSSNLTTKNKKVLTTGGQLIRILANSSYTFPAGTTVTVGGVAATATVGGGNVNGNYLTLTTPARPAGAATLVITANGVSKTFTGASTGLTYWAPPTIASVTSSGNKAVKSGESGGPVVITGTGFSTTPADNGVTVCGQDAVETTSTTTSITFALPDPQFASGYAGICPVRVTVAGDTSPINTFSRFAYLTE